MTKQQSNSVQIQDQRITELETRILYLEDTIESLNHELTALSQQFGLAKQALQMMHKKLEHAGNNPDGLNNLADEPPPPHY